MHKIEITLVDDARSRFAKELRHFDDEETAGSVLNNALLATVNNLFEHKCLEEVIALLYATSQPDAPDDLIRGSEYLLKSFPSVSFLAHQICANWFLVRHRLFDVDLPWVLLAYEMGLRMTFAVLAAALFAKTSAHLSMSNKEYLLSFFLGHTFRQWKNEVE